jgi:FtsZ-binding cell division protein ZapB
MKKENNLTEDEKTEITKLNAEYQSCVFSIGELALKKTQLQKEMDNLIDDENEILSTFESMRQKESDFINRLESKYGIGRLDANTGKYIAS